MSFFEELKRRNVFRVGTAYIVAAWLVIQVVETLFPVFDFGNQLIRGVVIILAIGLIPALILAWAFELTPEGLKKERDVDRNRTITEQPGKKLDRIIMAVLALALAYFAFDKFVFDPVRDSELVKDTAQKSSSDSPADEMIDKSIAVLPFLNMSEDLNNEYFADGISEEILNSLTKVRELKVAGRTSSFAFKGRHEDLRQIGEALGVSHLLEGSVRKNQNRVRITAQLIQAKDGFHLWSEMYDRELEDVFAIQDEIANAIAESLKVTLNLNDPGGVNLTGTTNLSAYDAYLRGINQWHLRTAVSLSNSVELFKQAIAIDPQFARAHAGLALAYAVMDSYTDMPTAVSQNKTRQAAEKALELDPLSVEAATALIQTTSDIEQQQVYGRKAIELNPSFATTHQWYGTALALTGDLEAAEHEYLKAAELDPRSKVIANALIYLYLTMKDWDESERHIERVLSWAPEYYAAMRYRFLIEFARQDYKAAREAGLILANSLGKDAHVVEVYLDAFFQTDRGPGARQELQGWLDQADRGGNYEGLLNHLDLVNFFAWSGDFANALKMVQRSIENDHLYLYGFLRVDRSMPEFLCEKKTQAVFDAAGLPPLKQPYPCRQGP